MAWHTVNRDDEPGLKRQQWHFRLLGLEVVLQDCAEFQRKTKRHKWREWSRWSNRNAARRQQEPLSAPSDVWNEALNWFRSNIKIGGTRL